MGLVGRGGLWVGILAVGLSAVHAASAQDAVRIDPDNPKYLLFRGKPLVLISASEHYGSVINRPFDYEKYLDDAATAQDDRDADVFALSGIAERAESLVSVQAGVA